MHANKAALLASDLFQEHINCRWILSIVLESSSKRQKRSHDNASGVD